MAKLITLNKKRDFDNARNNGVRFFSRFFVFTKVERRLTAKERSIGIIVDGPRFGFVISKKVSKLAVIRNKIRRRLKEIIRKRISEFDSNYDYVIVARRNIVDMDFKAMDAQIEKAIKFLHKDDKDKQ